MGRYQYSVHLVLNLFQLPVTGYNVLFYFDK